MGVVPLNWGPDWSKNEASYPCCLFYPTLICCMLSSRILQPPRRREHLVWEKRRLSWWHSWQGKQHCSWVPLCTKGLSWWRTSRRVIRKWTYHHCGSWDPEPADLWGRNSEHLLYKVCRSRSVWRFWQRELRWGQLGGVRGYQTPHPDCHADTKGGGDSSTRAPRKMWSAGVQEEKASPKEGDNWCLLWLGDNSRQLCLPSQEKKKL